MAESARSKRRMAVPDAGVALLPAILQVRVFLWSYVCMCVYILLAPLISPQPPIKTAGARQARDSAGLPPQRALLPGPSVCMTQGSSSSPPPWLTRKHVYTYTQEPSSGTEAEAAEWARLSSGVPPLSAVAAKVYSSVRVCGMKE